MMQVIQVVVFILFLFAIKVDGVIKTSKTPVLLNLKKLIPGSVLNESSADSSSTRTKFKPARSKPLLFQQVLGLIPGSDFDFNVDKWRALQSCGLYHNLTAKTVMRSDGVALFIEGFEGPSLKFAPEISVGGSVTDPEMSGGVSFSLYAPVCVV